MSCSRCGKTGVHTCLIASEAEKIPETLTHYFKRMDAELQSAIVSLVDQLGKEQYFNALRRIGRLVELTTDKLQDVINKEQK